MSSSQEDSRPESSSLRSIESGVSRQPSSSQSSAHGDEGRLRTSQSGERDRDNEPVATVSTTATTHAILECQPQTTSQSVESSDASEQNSILSLPESVHIAPDGPSRTLPDWQPFTLRLAFLLTLLLSSTALGITTTFLTAYSRANYGLGSDDGSSALLFGWRFSPTLFAVVYTIGTGTLLVDVRRTELFARLSNPGGSEAAATLCFGSRQWWNDPFDALSKSKNNGRRAWTLLFASLLNILAFLIISPLSAGLLAPVNINVPVGTPLKSLIQPPNFAPRNDTLDSMILSTISGGLLDTATSAWISNEYFVRPFWPSSSDMPLKSTFNNDGTSQRWQAPTVAYKLEPECSTLSLQAAYKLRLEDLGLYDPDADTGSDFSINWNMTRLQLVSQDGCSINITESTPPETLFEVGGGWWSRSTHYMTDILRTDQFTDHSNITSYDYSPACGDRSIMVLYSAWNTESQSLDAHGSLCFSRYLQADLTASVSLENGNTSVVVDPKVFNTSAKPMDEAQYQLSLLYDSFFTAPWSSHFTKVDLSGVSDSSLRTGPLQALGAHPKYKNSLSQLLESPTLADDARKFQQQWFGQMMLDAMLPEQQQASTADTQGSTEVQQRRIVVIEGIGIAISVVLLLSSLLALTLIFSSRSHRRPLGLHHDPGNIAITASLVVSKPATRAIFNRLERSSEQTIDERLKRFRYMLVDGQLEVMTKAVPAASATALDVQENPVVEKPKKPYVLRLWMGLLFGFALTALVGGIIALYVVSLGPGLRQRALTYELDVSISSVALSFAPYSIIPTIFAVGIKLWFGAIEETLKRAQPFSTMLQHPAALRSSVLVEYTNAPMILGAFKAARRGHWLLVLVGMGALATEIFTIGISALWDREIQITFHQADLARQLQPRQVPAVINYNACAEHCYQDSSVPALQAAIFGNYITSWMYGATLELVQSAPTTAWSLDTWSFSPIDFQTSADTILKLSSNGSQSGITSLPYNISLETPALRARLDCHPMTSIANKSTWLTTWDFYNTTIDHEYNTTMWNASNRPADLKLGYELHAYIDIESETTPADGDAVPLANLAGVLDCCANETEHDIGEAVVAYWNSGEFSQTIFVKWIFGYPLAGLYNDSYNDPAQHTATDLYGQHYLWAKMPEIQLLKCEPFIEEANASVTVDLRTGNVQNYTITSDIRNATGAWTDDMVQWLSDEQNASYPFITGDLVNGTVSYGWMFWQAIMNAASLGVAGDELAGAHYGATDDGDHTFKLRERGLNVDVMSYSMLALANSSKKALLDADVLAETASRTFGTFFKHFASENLSAATGGSAFEAIGATLPPDLNQNPMTENHYVPGLATELAPSVSAVIQTPVDMLVMSPVAVFICLAMLGLLLLTTVIIYFRTSCSQTLPRDVDTLASVLAFVYSSDRLLEWANERKHSNCWKIDKMPDAQKARLGPFQSSDGFSRWGIELVD